MSLFRFSDDPAVRHRVHGHADGVQVDGVRLAVRAVGESAFVTPVDGRSEKLFAASHGDAVYVQLRGRVWRLEKIDPSRGRTGGTTVAAGLSLAPMPGVVVSLQAQVGQRVARGDALLVIESMKLQMTICAEADGNVAELPVAVGQSFQRAAVLARTDIEASAA